MNDHLQDVEETLARLTRGSRVSVTMIVVSAALLLGSVVYSATRLAPLEREIAELEKVKAQRKKEVEAAEQHLATLRSNIEKLYAVRVTPEDKIFELRASARATDRTSDRGPLYDFSVFINAAESTLDSVERVTYVFDHPTFRLKEQTSVNAADHFKVGYLGWGCLTRVSARVHFENGEQSEIGFNMCKSLGPQWWDEETADDPAIDGEMVEKMTRKRPINEEARDFDSPVQRMAPDADTGRASKLPPR